VIGRDAAADRGGPEQSGVPVRMAKTMDEAAEAAFALAKRG